MIEETPANKEFGPWALKRTMGSNNEKLDTPNLPSLTFDASPWGGRGILWRGGVPQAYTHFSWNEHSLGIVQASLGACKGQAACEILTLFMCTVPFSDVLSASGALIRGDNLGSFNVA